MHAQLFVPDWDEDFLLLDVDICSIVVDECYADSLKSQLIFVYSLHYRHLPLSVFIVDEEMGCLL